MSPAPSVESASCRPPSWDEIVTAHDRIAPRIGLAPQDEIAVRYREAVGRHAGKVRIVVAVLFALILGLAEQLGSVYIPTYAIVVTFLIMVLVLALRPQGLLARR